MPHLSIADSSRNTQVGLAPMEGVTCFATRLWFSVVSRPTFAMTPFLRVTRDYPWKRIPSTYAAEIFDLKGIVSYSLIPQLMGNAPDDLERIAAPLLLATDFVDINCGCPSPKVVGSHAGSSLLENPDTFYEFTGSLEQRLGEKRYSIKMRSGFHAHSEFSTLLAIVAQRKLAQLTLHPRTRAEKYKSYARWELIAEASKVCPYPLVGSGDILDLTTFKQFLSQCPQVSKLIIGRGALRNPWIFQELKTGKQIAVSFPTLSYALASYAIMQDYQQKFPEKLLAAVKEGLFTETCYNCSDSWEKFYTKLTFNYYGNYIAPNEIVVDKQSFAKVKMIWNSLRSGLGGCFMEPHLLRTQQFSDFYHQLQLLFCDLPKTVMLGYNQEYNWIYSGEKKDGK